MDKTNLDCQNYTTVIVYDSPILQNYSWDLISMHTFSQNFINAYMSETSVFKSPNISISCII